MDEAPLSPAFLGKLARAALDNASELLGDASVLLEAGRFPRAFALSLLAAEEFGKHMACVSASALDLEDPAVSKTFWQRFRNHDAKYQNWHGQLIDPLDVDEDTWQEMWQEHSEMVEVAAAARLRAF